jgi:ribosomal protein S18 acetylase RimI-like enzyme
LVERWQKDMARLEANLKAAKPERCFLIAANNSLKKPVGFVLLFLKSQQQYFHELKSDQSIKGLKIAFDVNGLKDGEEVYVETLAVAPSFARKGIGTQLMNAIQKFLPTTKLIYLEVGGANEDAQKFYKKLEFIQQGNFATNAESCLIYSKVMQ